MADWENEESLEETARGAEKPQALLNQLTPHHVWWCLSWLREKKMIAMLHDFLYTSQNVLCTILYKQNHFVQGMSCFYFIWLLICFIYPISFHI